MKIYEEFAGTVDVDGVEYTYEGLHRDWNPLPGWKPPEGTVWEVHVDNLPALFMQRHAMGFGASKEEALRRLVEMIRKLRNHADEKR